MAKVIHELATPKKQVLKLKQEAYASKPRQEWANSCEFFLSALGYAVGLGNVWRYPYLCYENGGGVFIIPYFVCVLFLGIPLVYLEMIVGQFSSHGPLTSWRMVKISRGIGLTINLVNAVFIVYYTMIIAYSFYYMAISVRIDLPWIKCQPSFASPSKLGEVVFKNLK
jgi:SNF family Na+-dependent transporter